MSTPIRESVERHEDVARQIQDFLWEGKPFKSKRINHTEEEYRNFLESIREGSWKAYDNGAESLGWK